MKDQPRDTLADLGRLDRLINSELERLNLRLPSLSSKIEEKGPDAIGAVLDVVDSRLRIAEAQYSRGDSIEDVRSLVVSALDDLERLLALYRLHPDRLASPPISYLRGFRYSYFAVAFDVQSNAAQHVVGAIDLLESADDILGGFRRKLDPQRAPGESVSPGHLDFPDLYAELWRAMSSRGVPEAASALKTYLDSWYRRNEGTVGAGLLGLAPPRTASRYRGYWCWESVAVVLMTGIDDSSFRDHQFYPHDLADWGKAR